VIGIYAALPYALSARDSLIASQSPASASNLLFAPRSIYIPTSVAASGLPTLTSLGIGGITTTGATLTVNA